VNRKTFVSRKSKIPLLKCKISVPDKDYYPGAEISADFRVENLTNFLKSGEILAKHKLIAIEGVGYGANKGGSKTVVAYRISKSLTLNNSPLTHRFRPSSFKFSEQEL
jgi:hypothetical protein